MARLCSDCYDRCAGERISKGPTLGPCEWCARPAQHLYWVQYRTRVEREADRKRVASLPPRIDGWVCDGATARRGESESIGVYGDAVVVRAVGSVGLDNCDVSVDVSADALVEVLRAAGWEVRRER